MRAIIIIVVIIMQMFCIVSTGAARIALQHFEWVIKCVDADACGAFYVRCKEHFNLDVGLTQNATKLVCCQHKLKKKWNEFSNELSIYMLYLNLFGFWFGATVSHSTFFSSSFFDSVQLVFSFIVFDTSTKWITKQIFSSAWDFCLCVCVSLIVFVVVVNECK